MKESKASDVTKLTFEFLVHTACRSGEARSASWSEIDLAKRVWTIPATRMKMKRDHRIPLSDRAIEILNAAAKERRDGNDLVFPSSKGRPLSDMTLSKLVKELGIGAVPHGFRSSFKDWASETTNHPHQAVEMALAHTIQNKTEAAYGRSDLLERRRPLMADWSDYISKSRVDAEA